MRNYGTLDRKEQMAILEFHFIFRQTLNGDFS